MPGAEQAAGSEEGDAGGVPGGVLLVVDESALLSSDGVIERLAKLLGQAAAAAAAGSRRRVPLRRVRRARTPAVAVGHQGAPADLQHARAPEDQGAARARAPPPRGQRRREQAVYRIESVLKALHNLRQQGDRSVRAARLLGITSEEACRNEIDDPPQPVRDAVKIAAKHAALCRVVFLVSEDQKSLSAARQRSILSGGVDAAAAFLEELIAEMWSETVTASAKPWANGAGSSARRERGAAHDSSGKPMRSNASFSTGGRRVRSRGTGPARGGRS